MSITDFMIPAWVIGAMAVLSAVGIFSIRAMPILIRISLSVPFTYFGILYFFINNVTIDQDIKTTLVRFGLFSIFLAISTTSALVVWAKHTGIRL